MRDHRHSPHPSTNTPYHGAIEKLLATDTWPTGYEEVRVYDAI
jgi:hypothetical protein